MTVSYELDYKIVGVTPENEAYEFIVMDEIKDKVIKYLKNNGFNANVRLRNTINISW